jgi:hypothetical protein
MLEGLRGSLPQELALERAAHDQLVVDRLELARGEGPLDLPAVLGGAGDRGLHLAGLVVGDNWRHAPT